MKNERGAGRKSKLGVNELDIIKSRITKGESVAALAKEFGLSRQALYKRLKDDNTKLVVLDYVINGEVATRIELDPAREVLHIQNYALKLSERAFGIKDHPTWDDFNELIEKEYCLVLGMNENANHRQVLCQDIWNDEIPLNDVINHPASHLRTTENMEFSNIPVFHFTKKNIIYIRTDTDGFQLKAFSDNREWFAKAQAIISGVKMDDWAVELIASDLCEQLNIPHVEQMECDFCYGKDILHAVYSKNYELDGYSFISFERLLGRIGHTSNEEEFIHLDAIGKMKWCAEKLAVAGSLSYDNTLKYMLDLALIDCLVGNVDRHAKNFGLFYNSFKNKYEIPLIFDNGMGLFEHDYYRDHYTNFEDAMRTVYVSPYGEDPFDMIELLKTEFELHQIYPDLARLEYRSNWCTPYAREYMMRMLQCLKV